MRVLVVGGTIFVGRAVVAELLAQGHEVTVFHRGKHEQPFGDRVQELLGDRRAYDGLGGIFAGRTFDACIDTCGYVPEEVKALLDALEGVTERYLFCSTCSVYDYDRLSEMPLNEDAPLVEEPPESDKPGADYGYQKVRCEREALGRERFETTIIRPSYILGPHEPYYREPYFFERAEAGRPVYLPQGGGNVFNFGDVRDLARVFVRAIDEVMTCGRAYHVSGPAVTLRHLTETALRAAGVAQPEIIGYDAGLLRELAKDGWSGEQPPLPFPFTWKASLVLDMSRAMANLEWQPAPSLTRTLEDAYGWWVEAGRPNARADWRLDEGLAELIAAESGT